MAKDYIGVDAWYLVCLDQLHTTVERCVGMIPADGNWYGWEPSNEFMRELDGLRELLGDIRACGSNNRAPDEAQTREEKAAHGEAGTPAGDGPADGR